MNVAIVGCGRMGRRRAESLPTDVRVACVWDTDALAANKLAKDFRCVSEHWKDQENIDGVFICTPHCELFGAAHQALSARKHVLVEKPGALTDGELRALRQLAQLKQRVLHVGYTIAQHPGIQDLLLHIPAIGELLFIRARYGHGGRPGYEHEWRARHTNVGGGVLLDLGTHLVHLILNILGRCSVTSRCERRDFWSHGNDYARLTLESAKGHALIEVSSYEWKNRFEIEVYGRDGKLTVSGLGGAYGPETFTYHAMKGLKAPDSRVTVYAHDDSVARDTDTFLERCRELLLGHDMWTEIETLRLVTDNVP